MVRDRVTEGDVARVTQGGAPRLEMQAAVGPGVPITILNFPPVLGQILDAVNSFTSDWQAVAGNQNTSLQNELDIINILRDQTSAISNLGAQVAALNVNIGAVVQLMTAIIGALGDVANLTVQDENTSLLLQVIRILNAFTPVSVGLDLSSSTTEPQAVPSRPGP